MEIKHDVDGHLFFVKVKGGFAQLKYDRHGEDYLDFKETYIPEDSRDFGIGSKLVAHGLEFARASDSKVKATCPYVDDFIKKHQEYEGLRY